MHTINGRSIDEVVREDDEKYEAAIRRYDELMDAISKDESLDPDQKHILKGFAGLKFRAEVEKILRGGE